MLPAPFDAVATAFLVVFGMIVGSFLNVVIWRLPRGESIVYPGSHCPHCGASVRASDNIPVLGWLILRGKCRSCRGPISARYPLVEATAGLLTYLFVQRDGFVPLLAFHLVFAYVGLALALIDLDTFILPFSLTLPLIPIAVASGYFNPNHGLARSALGAGIGWSLIVLIGKVGELIAGREAMGGGDAWLMASIGGFTGPLKLLVALFLASTQGAIIGMWLIRRRRKLEEARPPEPKKSAKKKKKKDAPVEDDEWEPAPTAVPFGPFLVLGALEALLWGEPLLRALGLDQLGLWG